MTSITAIRHTADHLNPDAVYRLLVHLAVRGCRLRRQGRGHTGDETDGRDEAISIHPICS